MFQTLKVQNRGLGDLEYIVRSSIPASNKAKTKKQPACTRCKMKKLKCIIDADSCEKCIERGVRCSYRVTGEPGNRNSQSPDHHMAEIDMSTSSDGTLAYNKTSSYNTSSQSGASFNGSSDSSPPSVGKADASLSINGDEDHYSAFIDPAMGTPQFMADLTAWTPSLDQEVCTVARDRLPEASLKGGELQGFDICFCVDLVLAANATMLVKSVWGISLNCFSTSSIDDMFQCQKNVLTSCETLLGCSKCSLRSDYVVLVISMCREMVSCVKVLESITSPETQSGSSEKPNLDSKANLEAGGWRLDDEDEIEIIRHLIKVRITKLRKLIDQLEHIVTANYASYTWVVGSLKQNLDNTLGSIGE
ncbi:hypothetical protein GGI42DRAFT_356403 [Trichoderma sp. SZMC 28013]